MDLGAYIKQIDVGKNLTLEQSFDVFTIMTSGHASEQQMAALLLGLKQKGETIDEIFGACRALLTKAKAFQAPIGTIDTCGTGGDHSGSVNISTAVALLVAACGVPVAKHGNRSVTSQSGSADVLEALGVNITASTPVMEKALAKTNFCFIMAPYYHSAMQYVAGVRKKLGTRTIFNLLGPLINPANITYQLLGVYDESLLEPMAHVLQKLERQVAWVVHGHGGLDELSISGPSKIIEIAPHHINQTVIDPTIYGLAFYPLEALKGKDAKTNAIYLEDLLKGDGQLAYREIVILNAAACLVVAKKVQGLQEAINLARDVLSSGKAYGILQEFKMITQAA